MIDQTIEIKVPCSREEAFAYVAEQFFAHHRSWDPAITELAQTSPGPIGVGTTGREVRQFAGRQVADFRVTEYEQPSRFAFTNTSGAFWLDRAYTFVPDDGGTQLRFTFNMRPRAMPVKILFPLFKGTITKQVKTNIRRLESLLSSKQVAMGA